MVKEKQPEPFWEKILQSETTSIEFVSKRFLTYMLKPSIV